MRSPFMTTSVDVAVIGAGAAGIAAGRTLHQAGADVLILEARDRIGGRAWTTPVAGFPLDLGAGWLHSADVNPLSGAIEAAGFAIDRTPPPWERQSQNHEFSPEDQRAFRRALGELEGRIEARAGTGEDCAVADLFDPGGQWNPLLDAFSSVYNGAPFHEVSVIDYDRYTDTDVNWRVAAGYGAGLAALSSAPVALGIKASRIEHGDREVRIVTTDGVLTAHAVVIAAPTAALAREVLTFDPPLPDKVEAAVGLPLGLANKLFLQIDDAEELPKDGHLFGRTGRVDTGGYHLRPFGRPLIEVFVGGDTAWALEAQGPGALLDFATGELVDLLGSDMRRRIRPLAGSAWGVDPFAGGSYSHALPGCAGLREVLAAPVDHRLFFAGEACSTDFFSTVHGAWITGVEAGKAALAAISA
jgi:monoamine oxidase